MQPYAGRQKTTGGPRRAMAGALWNTQNGPIARDWILENKAGRPDFKAMRRIHAESLIEEVGGELRGMFSWIKKD